MSDIVTSRFRIDGMDCASCAAKVVKAAEGVAGVSEVSVSVTAGTMLVRHDDDADLKTLARRIASLGYTTRAGAAPVAVVV